MHIETADARKQNTEKKQLDLGGGYDGYGGYVCSNVLGSSGWWLFSIPVAFNKPWLFNASNLSIYAVYLWWAGSPSSWAYSRHPIAKVDETCKHASAAFPPMFAVRIQFDGQGRLWFAVFFGVQCHGKPTVYIYIFIDQCMQYYVIHGTSSQIVG